jgi:hypothetical protein
VLCTDYRLRTIAAGDRARFFLKGEGDRGDEPRGSLGVAVR